MKFKIGDRVKLNPKMTEFEYHQGEVTYEETGTIVDIQSDGDILIDFPNQRSWRGLEPELIFSYENIKVGDKVKINKKITLEDLTKDYWHGCQIGTMDFLSRYSRDDFDDEFTVTEVSSEYVKLKEYEKWRIDNRLFEVVERAVKEMTIAEISKELGYDIKIVKEDE